MTLNELIGPAVIAAVVSGLVSLIGNIFSNRSSRTINSDKIASELHLAERKFDFEKELAEKRFRYERELHDYGRRVEFAEDVLASFYKLQDTIREIRVPFSYEGEGVTRKRGDQETVAEARSRNHYYAPIERMNKHKDFLSELISKQYRAQAVFQNDIDHAFALVTEVLHSIQISSNMLVHNVKQGSPYDPTLMKELERDIWAATAPGEPDPNRERIEQAIEIVERAVRPALQQRTSVLLG
ncbi:hypothetical protein ACQR1I_14170 [Bradyrhizobium sp. HKCCYLS2038]|uniref:hypothetical protein n=1 Tax=unclassified Bradyrhizobium TaxID=2631580 RepID=UPI003EBC3BA3